MDLLETGRLISNKTSVVLVNNVPKTERLTVPAGMRWYLFAGRIENKDDVNRNGYVSVEDDVNANILMLKPSSQLVPNQVDYFPNNDDLGTVVVAAGCYPIPLDAGWSIRFEWATGGASTGGTAVIAALCIEVVV